MDSKIRSRKITNLIDALRQRQVLGPIQVKENRNVYSFQLYRGCMNHIVGRAKLKAQRILELAMKMSRVSLHMFTVKKRSIVTGFLNPKLMWMLRVLIVRWPTEVRWGRGRTPVNRKPLILIRESRRKYVVIFRQQTGRQNSTASSRSIWLWKLVTHTKKLNITCKQRRHSLSHLLHVRSIFNHE